MLIQFIFENTFDMLKEIKEYANRFYGNGVEDLPKGWEREVENAEFAMVEFYQSPSGD